MIMLYGVSDSIKSSVDRQVREERIISTLDELISSESSSLSSEDKELEEYLGTSGKSSKKKSRKSKKQDRILMESSISTEGNSKFYNNPLKVIN